LEERTFRTLPDVSQANKFIIIQLGANNRILARYFLSNICKEWIKFGGRQAYSVTRLTPHW
jgi:hypothetical protein